MICDNMTSIQISGMTRYLIKLNIFYLIENHFLYISQSLLKGVRIQFIPLNFDY